MVGKDGQKLTSVECARRYLDTSNEIVFSKAAIKDFVSGLLTLLDESVMLQSHYAKILNMCDGGERIVFENSLAWAKRLEEEEAENDR